MDIRYIKIQEYKSYFDWEIEPFLVSMVEEGVIHLHQIENETFLDTEDLTDIEKYLRWHRELGVNAAGIDVIRHLVERVASQQLLVRRLRQRLQELPEQAFEDEK